ncbi:NADH-ubiquinone oxidoreductase subunit E family protein [uncultured Campylobacter sp.]|uniref:NADH-ubiquinone oxidoreductase subunit E family protein n=1 Tax=uncultured Campylobacter sp. TaxID=218934 RepID=UPI00263584D5|nr:NADH-ubiquinone oxidoreductase subunit E family protein [uncultured Campylobacter sp.]
MKRYDLRHLKGSFLVRMGEILKDSKSGEVMIFLFEIGDYSSVKKSVELVSALNLTLLNSLKFNQVDWTIVVKRGII